MVDECFLLNKFASQEVCGYSSDFHCIDEDRKLCTSIVQLVGISEMIASRISFSLAEN